MGDMGDIFNSMKDERKVKRATFFNARLDYATRAFERNNVAYKLCNPEIGHFTLYHNDKVIMNFWSYTGKVWIPSKEYSKNIGIHNCIKQYKRLVKEVNNGQDSR